MKVTFPTRLPHKQINDRLFEIGFDQVDVEGSIVDGAWMCVICQALPRRPTCLKRCGHLFCEMCIKQHFVKNPSRRNPFMAIQIADCPVCKRPFHLNDVLPWDRMNLWSQLAYKSRVVKCPFACTFKGNPFEVDDHQLYLCPKRTIKCPNDGCVVEGPAKEIEEVHFPMCEHLRGFCPSCLLPALLTKFEQHDCVDALKYSLKCRQFRNFPFPYFFIR